MPVPTIMAFYEEIARWSRAHPLLSWIGHGEADGMGCDDFVQRIGEIEPYGVRTGKQAAP
jgi:hypothetical protein